MTISINNIFIEATLEELTALMGRVKPCRINEGKIIQEAADIDRITANLTNEIVGGIVNGLQKSSFGIDKRQKSVASNKSVSESDTKAQAEKANISEAEEREILEILAEGLAHKRGGHLVGVGVGFGKNRGMSEEFECGDGRRFKITMRRR